MPLCGTMQELQQPSNKETERLMVMNGDGRFGLKQKMTVEGKRGDNPSPFNI